MTTTQQNIAPGQYRIDPAASSVRFATTMLFGLVTTRGTFAVREGRITLAEDRQRSTVHAVVDAASLATGSRRRDRDVTSRRYLDAAGFPEMTFTSRTVAPTGEGRAEVSGVMTVHGVAQEVRLDVTESPAADGEYRLLARARIDRTRFGVRTAVPLIGRFVDVEVEVTATR